MQRSGDEFFGSYQGAFAALCGCFALFAVSGLSFTAKHPKNAQRKRKGRLLLQPSSIATSVAK